MRHLPTRSRNTLNPNCFGRRPTSTTTAHSTKYPLTVVKDISHLSRVLESDSRTRSKELEWGDDADPCPIQASVARGRVFRGTPVWCRQGVAYNIPNACMAAAGPRPPAGADDPWPLDGIEDTYLFIIRLRPTTCCSPATTRAASIRLTAATTSGVTTGACIRATGRTAAGSARVRCLSSTSRLAESSCS